METSLENGKIPAVHNGMVNMYYSRYSNINGKVSEVNYQYTSDGKNVTLVKYTDNNGKIDNAVYKYDVKGKLLDVKEYKGKNLIDEKIHKYNI